MAEQIATTIEAHHHENNRCCFCEAEDDHECIMCPDYDGGAASGMSEPTTTTKATARPVYSAVTGGGHQGLVIEEETGRTVALTYDPNDAPRIARAVNRDAAFEAMVAALKGAQSALRKALPFLPADNEAVYCGEWLDEINEALALAQADGYGGVQP